jgi:hypothetical protein
MIARQKGIDPSIPSPLRSNNSKTMIARGGKVTSIFDETNINNAIGEKKLIFKSEIYSYENMIQDFMHEKSYDNHWVISELTKTRRLVKHQLNPILNFKYGKGEFNLKNEKGESLEWPMNSH